MAKIVAVANQHKTPLYPISQGKQWGMGSKLPVKDGAAIVDLSEMNRITDATKVHHVVRETVEGLILHVVSNLLFQERYHYH